MWSTLCRKSQELAVACLVVLEFPTLKLVHRDHDFTSRLEAYKPGFLGMREAPLFETLLARAQELPVAPQVCCVS